MACGVALKRPHEYDYLSPEGAGGKRPRTNINCPPFRPTFGTVAASLPQSMVSNGNNVDSASFASVQTANLSSQQLESYLRAEVRYLKRRTLIPRRRDTDSKPRPCAFYRAPGSPNQSASDSEGETSTSAVKKTTPSNIQTELFDKPQFSLKQVQMICERLLKEQELRLRYEYESVLNQRLEEQREQYVKFTEDQIESRFNSNDDISYLS